MVDWGEERKHGLRCGGLITCLLSNQGPKKDKNKGRQAQQNTHRTGYQTDFWLFAEKMQAGWVQIPPHV